jgi:anti-sigma factor RsiW
MIQTLPHPTLLRYVYNELPADEQHEVEEALQNDPELAETCAEMLLAQRTLNRLAANPRPETTATILQYSRTFLR